MKILFLAPANSSHTVKWVNALAARGQDVLLVSKGDHRDSDGAVDSRVRISYLPIVGGMGYYLNAPHLKNIYKAFSPDVVNAHYASGYGTLARISGIKDYILSVWGSDVYEFAHKNAIDGKIIKKNLSRAKVITSSGVGMAEHVREIMNARAERVGSKAGCADIRVVPFGVDLDIFKYMRAGAGSVASAGAVVGPDAGGAASAAGGDCFRVSSVKALEKNYGIDGVIYAFARFLNKIGGKGAAVLNIYGEGSERPYLEHMVKELALEDCVHFCGKISNDKVSEVYQNSDVACFGTERESFGVSTLEAMACGAVVIGTDTVGFREVTGGDSGIIISEASKGAISIEEMAEALLKIYADPNLADEYRKKARKRVEENYSWEENVSAMIDIYNEVSGLGKEEGAR